VPEAHTCMYTRHPGLSTNQPDTNQPDSVSRALPCARRTTSAAETGDYTNPQLQTLIDRLKATLDERGRADVLVELERFTTADVAIGYLYYQVRPAVVINGLKGVITLPLHVEPVGVALRVGVQPAKKLPAAPGRSTAMARKPWPASGARFRSHTSAEDPDRASVEQDHGRT